MTTLTPPTLPVRIDPRIRERRMEVRRQQGRRRLRHLGVVAVVIALGVASWASLGSPVLDVDHIRVDGALHTPPAAIVTAAGIGRGDPMIDVDAGAARRGVRELVWVQEAAVRRRWPGTVVITVHEREPRAVTRTNASTWALLDIEGRVLELVGERPPGLVELEGVLGPDSVDVQPGARARAIDGPLEVVRSLSAPLAARTSAVVVVHNGEIALKLNPRGIVRFGSADQVTAKVRAVETVLASVDSERLAVLDVRLPSSPALTRG